MNISKKISTAGAVIILLLSSYYVQLRTIQLISPLPPQTHVYDQVYTKLYTKHNPYKLTHPISFPPVVSADTNEIAASAYIVVDYNTGEIISTKNDNRPLPIASITKIMTAIVALDLSSPDHMITISGRAAAQIPTKVGVQVGEKFTLKELLHASLMTSANDATEAIRDGIDTQYGQPVFIHAMNVKAQLLGLSSSRFANPQGFDNPDNYSSVHDLAILSHYALTEYPLIAEIVKKDYELLPENTYHHRFDLYNWNGLLDVYPDVFGVKIGNTQAAGTTTVVVSERKGKRVLVALLGTPNVLKRDQMAAYLLDKGFKEKWNLEPVKVTEAQLQNKYNTWHYWN